MMKFLVASTILAMTTACVHTPTTNGTSAPISHLNVPVGNFGGILVNNFGDISATFVVFGPAASVALSSNEKSPVNPGFDFVITDVDYTLRAGGPPACDAADEGKEITLVIAVNETRNYLLQGSLDKNCALHGRDYMTTGMVVRASCASKLVTVI